MCMCCTGQHVSRQANSPCSMRVLWNGKPRKVPGFSQSQTHQLTALVPPCPLSLQPQGSLDGIKWVILQSEGLWVPLETGDVTTQTRWESLFSQSLFTESVESQTEEKRKRGIMRSAWLPPYWAISLLHVLSFIRLSKAVAPIPLPKSSIGQFIWSCPLSSSIASIYLCLG